MKIVFISNWFSEKMGYSENLFPKAMAKLGHEVHLITSTAQIYYNNKERYNKIYLNYLGPSIVEKVTKVIDGFTLHRLDFIVENKFPFFPFALNGIKLIGIDELLDLVKPDVIQSFNHDDPATLQAAKWASKNQTKFFTESHVHASVLRKNNKKSLFEVSKSILNYFNPKINFINRVSKYSFPIALDVAEIMNSLYHFPSDKCIVQSLGVDMELFTPLNSTLLMDERIKLRNKIGFSEDEIVCIYTGRFSKDKYPYLLAEAIEILQNNGEKFRGLFLGNGTTQEIENIKCKKGNILLGFIPVRDLAKHYRASDIGVWPREESTSQLDAAACGLPLVLSDKIHVKERIDGNGFLYSEGDAQSLADNILKLKDNSLRESFSKKGIQKVQQNYSWDSIAKKRIEYYNL
ncbi:MAG: glycosyltransferase family 4 protein [Bacteroidetes bacterium]|nr:glycosyltransferase family 4 protein [Bacteroidota bacterium]